jgi:16S rRNA G966 N2-methylase RsmD
MATEGIVVLEHSTKHLLPDEVLPLERWREARYGSTTLSFYA